MKNANDWSGTLCKTNDGVALGNVADHCCGIWLILSAREVNRFHSSVWSFQRWWRRAKPLPMKSGRCIRLPCAITISGVITHSGACFLTDRKSRVRHYSDNEWWLYCAGQWQELNFTVNGVVGPEKASVIEKHKPGTAASTPLWAGRPCRADSLVKLK